MCESHDYYTHGTKNPEKILKSGLGLHIKEDGKARATTYKLPNNAIARKKAIEKPGGMPTSKSQVIIKIPKGKTLEQIAKPVMISGGNKKHPLNAIIDRKHIVNVKKPKIYTGGGGKNAELIRKMSALSIPKVLE
tara:strand:+ start:4584 stop:4988 length:405 start_codon:yes stop_codon:yes gene_type:complete